MPHLPTQKRQRRSGYVTSSNGCETCKRRKIRCDMSRPICQQCSKSRRICEGPGTLQYQFVEPETAASFSAKTTYGKPAFQISSLPDSNEERRAFDYFLYTAAPTYAGQHNAEFWQRLVPRWSAADPILRSTIVSISLLHEQLKAVAGKPFVHARTLPGYKKSLEYHGRAICLYQQRLKSQNADLPAALLSCILFAIFEFHLWNIDNALSLLKSCYNLASQIRRCPIDWDLTAGVFRVFVRLSTLIQSPSSLPALLCGPSEGEDILRLALIVPLPLRLDEYRNNLYGLMHEASKITEEARFCNSTALAKDLVYRQMHLLKTLDSWRADVLEFQNTDVCDFYIWVTSLLLTYYWVSHIQLSVCLENLESAYDHHLDAFEELVQQGNSALEYALSSDRAQSPLLYELNLILPLFFAAFKCRHPRVRRQARSLIEGFENLTKTSSPWVVDVVDAIIDVEECDIEKCASVNHTSKDLALIVPTHRRVRQFHVSKVADDIDPRKEVLMASLVIHTCVVEFESCVRRVGVRLDTEEIMQDDTAHARQCQWFMPGAASALHSEYSGSTRILCNAGRQVCPCCRSVPA